MDINMFPKREIETDYKEWSTVMAAVAHLKAKGCSGFICAGKGPGGIDIICNHNGILVIVEVKFKTKKLSLSDFKSGSKAATDLFLGTEKYLDYLINKGRQQNIVEKNYVDQVLAEANISYKELEENPIFKDIWKDPRKKRDLNLVIEGIEKLKLLDSHSYRIIYENFSEIEQTKQSLSRYVQGKDKALKKIWYIKGGGYNEDVENFCRDNDIVLIHNEKIITKSKTFDLTFPHPDQGGMPAIPSINQDIDLESQFESSKWDSLEEDYKGPDWQKETKGDIE